MKTKRDKKIILPDSPEAATQKTMTFWVSRTGKIYEDEQVARYEGSTHKKCECGNICEKHWIRCDVCRAKQKAERYKAMPFKKWDRVTPLCLFDSEIFFFNEEDIDLYCEENKHKPELLDLVICEPLEPPVLSADFFDEYLPSSSDSDLPEELQKAINDFNATVAACKTPLSWREGKYRTVYNK